MSIATLFAELAQERARQDEKWGEQNHPSVRLRQGSGNFAGSAICQDLGIPSEGRTKELCKLHVNRGDLSWADIALEEFAEAVSAPDDKLRREELVQLAAVVLAWIECLDRPWRSDSGKPTEADARELRFFDAKHLPADLREHVTVVGLAAEAMVLSLPGCAERSAGVRAQVDVNKGLIEAHPSRRQAGRIQK